MPLQGISQQLLESLTPSVFDTLQEERGQEQALAQGDQKTQLGQQKLDANIMKLAQGELNNKAQEANSLLTFDTPESLRANLIRRAQELQANPVPGLEATDFIDMANRLGEPNGFTTIQNELKSDIARIADISGKLNQLTSGQKEFKSLTSELSDEDKLKAKRIELGLDPRAGISAAERIAASPDITEDVATSSATIEARKEGAKETAKLSAQLKLKPEVDAAVVKAVAAAKLSADIKIEDRSNQKAFDVYNAAKSNLVAALGGTITGPGAGWIPALTANAQIANGAVAMMAPVLKQLFRASGEGTFTDKDQEMLIAMVPTRDTLPEARVVQLAAIDSIVSAKLGTISEEAKVKTGQKEANKQPVAGQKQGGVINIDANGNRAMVFPDGSFEEL